MHVTELWQLSKSVNAEILFQTQLSASGSQKNILLERYDKNSFGTRHAALLQNIIVSIFLLVASTIPAFALFQFQQTTVTAKNVYTVLFANSVSIAFYNITNLLFLLIFGLLSLITLMKGDYFDFLKTLPISNKDLSTLTFLVFIRMNFLQLLVIIFAFPIESFLITQSRTFFLIILVSNIMNLFFIIFFIVLLSHILSTRVFNSSTSRLQTFVRVAIVLVNMIVIFSISLLFQFINSFIQNLFTTQQINPSNGFLLNILLSLLFFPFSGGYLATLALLPAEFLIVENVFTALLGLLLLFLIIYILFRKSSKILQQLVYGQSYDIKTMIDIADIEVVIHNTTPIIAFMKKSLIVATRDFGTLIYLITPIIFPIFGIIFSGNRSGFSFDDPFIFLFMYIGVIPFSLNLGLSASEENLGGIMSSLPYRSRDLFRSRQILLIAIANVPVFIIALLELNRLSTHVFTIIDLIFLNILIATVYLLTLAYLFGKLNVHYTLNRVNQSNKTVKYIIQFSLMYGLLLFYTILISYLSRQLGTIFNFGIYGHLIYAIIIFGAGFILLELQVRRMFN